MKRIGLLSDTHGYWDARYEKYFAECDEIWHAGDIGTMELAERLADLRPLRAVCGNCDGGDLRRLYPTVLRFRCEEADVLMKHIGGYPGNYDRSIRGTLFVPAAALHLRTLAHPESALRQDTQLPAHQSRRCRTAGMAKSKDTGAIYGRRQAIPRP